jgi:hypothetical protein
MIQTMRQPLLFSLNERKPTKQRVASFNFLNPQNGSSESHNTDMRPTIIRIVVVCRVWGSDTPIRGARVRYQLLSVFISRIKIQISY